MCHSGKWIPKEFSICELKYWHSNHTSHNIIQFECMVKTWFTCNLEQEEGVGAETCRNSDMAWKLRALGQKRLVLSKSKFRWRGYTFLMLRFWSVRKSHGQLTGMHTHMEMLLPKCRPHFQGKEGPAPHLREKGQRHQGLTAFFKASLPLQSIRSSLPSSLPESWGTRSQRRGWVTDPWRPSHVWQAEGEESKPSQFRELSLVQGPHSPVSSGFIPRGVIALTFCRGECGVDGEAINYSTTCLLSNRSHFVWRGRERRKTMKRQ